MILSAHDFMVHPTNYDAVVLWGYLRGPGRIFRYALDNSVDFYYLDHAYLRRNTKNRNFPNAMYRITKNAMQPLVMRERPSDRWDRHFGGTRIKNWVNGDTVLLCPPSKTYRQNFDVSGWEEMMGWSLSAKCQKLGLKLKVRNKGDKDPIDWSALHTVVTYNSNIAVEALMNGVPVIAENSVCRPVSGTLENPWRGERMPFFHHLAYSQFTIHEFRSGEAYAIASSDA